MDIKNMLNTMPQVGKVEWLSYRPRSRANVEVVDKIEIEVANSIVGDHFSGKAGSTRQITLIQAEHIAVVSGILGHEISPPQLRRNVVVSGINLQALKGQDFKIGNAILKGTGNCPPCSRMEENLGPGGYNAMRGHGGITASVVESGVVCVGDSVQLLVLQ